MFHKILVAIDGSTNAERALSEAIDLARQNSGSLTVFGCVPDISGWMLTGNAYAGVSPAELDREADSRYQELLSRAATSVPDEITVRTALAHGHPAEEIIAEVTTGGHDLVVMGSRGRSELRSLVLGSVSHHVLNASPAAVLIVRAENTPSS